MQSNRSSQNIIAFVIFFAAWFALAFFTGIFNGGFQLVDDVLYADYYEQLQHKSIWNTFISIFHEDLSIRFRPVALLDYVLVAKIFKLNYTSIITYNLCIASLSCYFYYRFVNKIGFSFVQSLVFVGVLYLGNQGSIGLRTVLSENIAMLLLSISLLALASKNKFLSFIFFILAACTKESFLLLMPALVVGDFLLHEGISFKQYLKKNATWITSLVIACAAILSIIIFKVGTHSIGYAGIDTDTFATGNLFITAKRLLVTKGYLIPVLIAAIFIFMKEKSAVLKKEKVISFILFLGLIAISQILLFSKSYIFMHYLLPGMFWSAFTVIVLWRYMSEENYPFIHKLIFRLSVIVLLSINSYLLVKNSISFAKYGKGARESMEFVTAHSKPNDPIIIIGHPLFDFERAADANGFLRSYLYNREPVIIPSTTDISNITDRDKLSMASVFIQATNTDHAPASYYFGEKCCILFLPNTYNDAMNLYKNDLKEYTITDIGEFKVAIKK